MTPTTPPLLPHGQEPFVVTGPAEEFLITEVEAGQPCTLCDDRALALGEPGMRVPTDHGVKLHHAVCFYSVKCSGLEQFLAQAQANHQAVHQMLCSVLAKTGKIRIYPHHIERALKAEFEMHIERLPDGSTTLKLKGSAIEVVESLPPNGKLVT